MKEKRETNNLNMLTIVDYEDRLKLIATSLFNWVGLDEVAGVGASRFLESRLYENGRASFVKDNEVGYLITNVQPTDKLNIYNLPDRVYCTGRGYNKEYEFDDIVYIINNNLEIPTFNTIHLFALRLSDTQRAIDVNLNASKTPILIEGDTKSILTLKNAYAQYSGNAPVIYGTKGFDINSKLNVLRTDSPYLVDKLELHKHELWNECLSFLGINNANTDKKERLITDEVNSNNELINYYLNCFLKPRKKACEEINKKYGLNISVEINNDILKMLDIDFKEEVEGDINE